MAVEKAVRDILISSTGVSSIVSERVYNGFAPQEVDLPFIIFQRERTERVRTLDGPDGLVEADFEVNCVSLTSSQLQMLADEVRLAMDNYTGSTKGVAIQRMMLDNETETVEVETSGSDKRIRVRSLDFTIWYCETPAA